MKTTLLRLALLFVMAGPLMAETPASPPPAAPAPPDGISAPVKHLTAPEAAKALAAANAAGDPKKAITVLDVRSVGEFAEGHLKGAKNIDIFSPDFEKSLAALDPAKTYLVHCASGGRSTRSLKTFDKLGFKSLLHLDGGLSAWKEAGLPVDTTPAAAP